MGKKRSVMPTAARAGPQWRIEIRKGPHFETSSATRNLPFLGSQKDPILDSQMCTIFTAQMSRIHDFAQIPKLTKKHQNVVQNDSQKDPFSRPLQPPETTLFWSRKMNPFQTLKSGPFLPPRGLFMPHSCDFGHSKLKKGGVKMCSKITSRTDPLWRRTPSLETANSWALKMLRFWPPEMHRFLPLKNLVFGNFFHPCVKWLTNDTAFC